MRFKLPCMWGKGVESVVEPCVEESLLESYPLNVQLFTNLRAILNEINILVVKAGKKSDEEEKINLEGLFRVNGNSRFVTRMLVGLESAHSMKEAREVLRDPHNRPESETSTLSALSSAMKKLMFRSEEPLCPKHLCERELSTDVNEAVLIAEAVQAVDDEISEKQFSDEAKVEYKKYLGELFTLLNKVSNDEVFGLNYSGIITCFCMNMILNNVANSRTDLSGLIVQTAKENSLFNVLVSKGDLFGARIKNPEVAEVDEPVSDLLVVDERSSRILERNLERSSRAFESHDSFDSSVNTYESSFDKGNYLSSENFLPSYKNSKEQSKRTVNKPNANLKEVTLPNVSVRLREGANFGNAPLF